MSKKYDPEKMIAKSRFRNYYATWEPDNRLHLISRMSQLLEENANMPTLKTTRSNEIIYSGEVVQKLEEIIDHAKKLMQEISIIDFSKVA